MGRGYPSLQCLSCGQTLTTKNLFTAKFSVAAGQNAAMLFGSVTPATRKNTALTHPKV